MLFSDIEGSTSLLSRLGGRYVEALDLRRRNPKSSGLRWPGPDRMTAPTPERARLGLRLCAALAWFWEHHGFFPETLRWHERALEVDSGADSRERAAVLVSLGLLLEFLPHGDLQRPTQVLEQALNISRRLGDRAGICDALSALAFQSRWTGDIGTAAERIEESMAIASQLGDNARLAWAMRVQGDVERAGGNLAGAIELGE
jgi:hypothetical protein